MSHRRVNLTARKDENRAILDTNSNISARFGRRATSDSSPQLITVIKLQHDQAGMAQQMV